MSRGTSVRVCDASERRETLMRACNASIDDVHDWGGIRQSVLNNIFVDDKHKILGCFVAKAACSTWKYMLINATGNSQLRKSRTPVHSRDYMRSVGLHTLADFDSDEVNRRLATYFKFVVVRHPFERLLSAYREKLAGQNAAYQRGLGRAIVRRYRKQPSDGSLSLGDDVTFGEFVRYVIDVDPGERDDHWLKVGSVCDPCRVGYDYVAKVETMSDDSRHILPRLDLPVGPLPRSNADSGRRQLSLLSTADFFAGVPPGHRQRLYEIYADDFDTFGYSWDDSRLSADCVAQTREPKCC